MTLVFSLLTLQTFLGALDTFWNHEYVERLPSRRGARLELALHAARRFSKNVEPHEDWETLLRRGIRGATVPEIMGILRRNGAPVLLEPRRELGDRIDLWYSTLSRRHAWFKRSLWASLKMLKALSGAQLTPSLTLAIRKQA